MVSVKDGGHRECSFPPIFRSQLQCVCDSGFWRKGLKGSRFEGLG